MKTALGGLIIALCALCAAPLAAQQAVLAQEAQASLRSPILTIDPERLYSESIFGQKVVEDYLQRSEALAAENRAIEAELSEAEQDLTARRPAMTVADFRTEAEAFDARVQKIRADQDQKQRDLQNILTQGREDFLASITNDLAEIMVEAGAAVILDRRSVFLAVGLVDITETAISEINKTYLETNPAPQDDTAQ